MDRGRAAFAQYTVAPSSTTSVRAAVDPEEPAEPMSVAGDDAVPRLETQSRQREAACDGQWAQDRHDGGDPKQRCATSFPPTCVVADVHPLQEEMLGRSIDQGRGRALQGQEAQPMPAVEPVEGGRTPGAEAAVGVEEHDQLRSTRTVA